MEHIGPPAVGSCFLWVEITEGIGKARVQQRRHFPTLLGREARVALIALGIFQINGLMGDVQVAAEHHGLFCFQLLEAAEERVLPLHPIVQPGQLPLGVGGVDGEQIEVAHVEGNDAPLVVMLLQAQTVGHVKRLLPGENSRAGVALLFRVVPILMIPRQV